MNHRPRHVVQQALERESELCARVVHSYAIGFFVFNASEELMLTHAGGSVKEDVVWFNLCGTDRLRLGRTSQY